MKFRNRKDFNVTDIEAARRASSGLGAYHPLTEADIAAVARSPIGPRGGESLYWPTEKLASVTELTSVAVEGSPVAEMPPRPPGQEAGAGATKFPSDECVCGGHLMWIDRGNHFDGVCCHCGERISEFKPDHDAHLRAEVEAVWERRFRQAGLEVPDTIARAAQRIDELKQENAALQRVLSETDRFAQQEVKTWAAENAALKRKVETLQNQLADANARADGRRMSP